MIGFFCYTKNSIEKGANNLEEKKLKRILEYVWIAVVLLVGYYFLKEKVYGFYF